MPKFMMKFVAEVPTGRETNIIITTTLVGNIDNYHIGGFTESSATN